MHSEIVIKNGDFYCPDVQNLLRDHLTDMHKNSPPGAVFALDWSALQHADVTFFTAHIFGELAGCGALKHIHAHKDGIKRGEIKSMRTAQQFLRKGVAAALLHHIIAQAQQRNYDYLSLETGSGEAFDPAIALYQRHGFAKGAAFGDYQQSAFNQFFHLKLTD